MSADQRLAKIYSDQVYKRTAIVRHQGVVIAFAMDAARRIYYSVLDPRQLQEGQTDADEWPQDPTELGFPTEVTEVGYAAGGNATMPTVALGGRVETTDPLFPEEIDPFLSSTARLTADAPISVYSDGANIFVFRQAIAADHPDALFLLQSGATTADVSRQDLVRDAAGNRVPVANASLLCDRFVLVSGQLQPTAEVRFRRSRHKTMPDSAQDSLGPQDMNGDFFQEPTQHFRLIRNLKDGCFCALQVPTATREVKYWQIFAYNSRTQRIDSFNIERSQDGLFNTQGTQFYTSPDPKYQGSVFERQPGTCPFTGQPLIPVGTEQSYADAGLLFSGATGQATLPDTPATALAGAPFTIEAWVRADQLGPGERPLVTKARKDGSAGFVLGLDAQGHLCAHGASGGAVITSKQAIAVGVWTHVATTYDGLTLQLLINGNPDGLGTPALADAGTSFVVGAGLAGMLDEVRLWGRARGADECKRDCGTTLLGQEPGLVAYYRCDEGTGAVLHDQTDNALHGTLAGATWATSEAPVGSHPGVRRDSFRFSGRALASPLAAVLYHQQERSGPGQALMKRQARVLLTCTTSGPGPDGQPTDKSYVAALDFAVARDGSLAQIVDEVNLGFIDTAMRGVTLDQISAVEQQIAKLKGDLAQVDLNGALSFDGSSDRVSLGANLQLNNSDFTIEFWLKRRELGREDYVLSLGTGAGNQGLAIGFDRRNVFRFVFWWNDLETPAYPDTDWHHWACTFNRRTLKRVVYRDGVPVASDTAGGAFAGSGELFLGYLCQNTPQTLARCLVDEVRIWGRERQAEEIKADLRRRLQGNEEALLAYYAFAKGDLRDRSGHGNNGKITSGNPTVDASVLPVATAQTVDQTRLAALETQLANMTGGQKGGDVAVPMPLLTTDGSGLTVMGALLGFAYGSHRPALLDSVTGDVNLYFRGQDGSFYAAPYDTTVARHAMLLPAGAQSLRLLARAAGLDLAAATFTVIDGTASTSCTVRIQTPRLSELWPDVPRDPQQFADVLNGRAKTYDYRKARSSFVGSDLSGGSLVFVVIAQGVSHPVDNGAASTASLAATTRFWSDAPGRAYNFDGQQQHLSLPPAKLGQVDVAGPATIEAWVNPAGLTGRARLLHANTPGSRYSLGLEPMISQDALSFDGSSDRVSLGTNLLFNNSDFTIEFWLKRRELARHDYVLSLGTGAANQGLALGIDNRSVFRFVFWGNDLETPAYPDTDWHHWACTFNRKTLKRVVYRDGVPVASDTAGAAFVGSGELFLGLLAQPNPQVLARCLVDEVRIWGRERQADEIKADMKRRLQGTEAGLWAYYTFAKGDLRDRSGHGNNGKITSGAPTVTTSILAARGYQVFAGVGPSYVRTRDTMSSTDWSHLAVSFNQAWALDFNGTTNWLNVGTDDVLNLSDDLTIEVFLQLRSLGRPAGVLGKGRMADGTGQRTPYQLSIAADGILTFSFETRDGTTATLSSGEALQPGVFYRIAAVRKSGQQASGNSLVYFIDLVLYFNGREVGRKRWDGEAAGSHSGPLDLGRACTGRQASYFPGVLCEVRLWSSARDPKDLGAAVRDHEKDLVARFPFSENRGHTTRDVAGGRQARIYGARWTRDPDPSGSALVVHVNGMTVPTDPVAPGSLLICDGDPQFTLGALMNSGKLQEAFCGTLDEVRVWRTCRTSEQILDNLFTRLRGERQDLLAYYTFSDDSTLPDSTRLLDEGPRGNHLPLPPAGDAARPAMVLSTAPVSSDTAEVRGALAGVKTAFHELIDDAPAVAEYGMMETDSHGDSGGAMKRCYSTIKNGAWEIVSGYKVGELFTEWVGQAQFDPQVIGFIEGAPPVPVENLIVGPLYTNTYDAATTAAVSFVQADQVMSSLSASAEASLRVGLELDAHLGGAFDMWTVTAPLGVGTAQNTLDIAFSAHTKVAADFDHSWSSDSQLSQGTNTAQTMTVALSGYWESDQQIPPGRERRFLPNNNGLALVQSATADVFALRLAGSGALVAYQMRPNPDIPRDWNIIPFPINPYYVKQGTLDGCIGADPQTGRKILDPSYPQAADYGEYSYYKPREAYALKQRILREQQRVQASFDNASTNPFAKADPRLRDALSALGGDAIAGGGATGSEADDAVSAKRSFVNTYVWTAAGGFFAESTETVNSFTESAAGSYSFNASITQGGGLGTEIAGVGLGLDVDATVGGGFSETRTKSREATRSFNLEVLCNPPNSMQSYDPNGNGIYDADRQPVMVNGRVDGYRFMTFLLASSSDNYADLFGKVIDPVWLKQSSDANAAALRQARQPDKQPGCWRIMHRVTYVSRTLPKVLPPDAPPVQKAMQAENIPSNWELIKRLEPSVKSATSSLSALAEATRNALAAEMPALLPHADQVTQYLALYYGMQ